MMSELDCYGNIFDDFLKTEGKEKEKILWKSFYIIKLMNKMKKVHSNPFFIENALRMIIVLFKNYEIDPCEIDDQSKPISECENKSEIKKILFEELI